MEWERKRLKGNKNWRMRAMCVCMLSVVIMSLCLCFQCHSVDRLPHSRFPLPTYAPLKSTGPQITPAAPERIPFRSCSPFCSPLKRVSLVRDWCVTPSFDVKSLENAYSSTKNREGQKERVEERESFLTIFHTCRPSKGPRGGRIPFWAPWGAGVKTDGGDGNRARSEEGSNTIIQVSFLLPGCFTWRRRQGNPEENFIAWRLLSRELNGVSFKYQLLVSHKQSGHGIYRPRDKVIKVGPVPKCATLEF